MKSTIKTLVITIAILILATLFFSYINLKPNYKSIAAIQQNEHPGKKLMETNCYACHNPVTSHDNRLAPPMIAVKRHYKNDNTTKKEFIDDFTNWVKSPSEELSKMPGAIRNFGIMPFTPFPEEDIRQIADYIYDNNIEQPEWFEEHHQQEMGNGKRQGMMKQQQSNFNKTEKSYNDIGMHYVLATKKELGENLMGAIQEKGTVGALEFCNEQALTITDSMANAFSVSIKRVSNKPRNPLNSANATELELIASFKKELATNPSIPEPIIKESGNEVKFYYPITTNMMCLQCHGQLDKDIHPDTYITIKKLYPNDKAIGYGINEVRGIWSIKFNKDE